MRLKVLAVLLLFVSLSCFAQRRAAFFSQAAPAAGGGGSDTAFVTGVTAGSDNSNPGLSGMKIVIGGASITVTSLGIIARADDTDTSKTVGIYDSSCNSITTVSVNTSSHDGQIHYATITPTVLSAGGTYAILFSNPNSQVFGINVAITHTAAATVPTDVWDSTAGTCAALFGAADHICGPVDFKYH